MLAVNDNQQEAIMLQKVINRTEFSKKKYLRVVFNYSYVIEHYKSDSKEVFQI